MEEVTHKDLLRLQTGELPERTPFCPDDQAVAEYFEGVSVASERLAFDRHLAECDFCLARIGSLDRLAGNRKRSRIPGELLASAKQLGQAARRRAIPAPAWSAAAVAVLAFILIIGIELSPFEAGRDSPNSVSPAADSQPQLRNAKPLARKIELIAPVAGGAFQPGSVIRWTEVPNTVHYQVFVLNSTGDVLWTERLRRAEWSVLEPARLQARTEYYFRVEAMLPDGRTVSSRHLPFQVSVHE